MKSHVRPLAIVVIVVAVVAVVADGAASGTARWCSGHHVCFKRRRSPVRTRVESVLPCLLPFLEIATPFTHTLDLRTAGMSTPPSAAALLPTGAGTLAAVATAILVTHLGWWMAGALVISASLARDRACGG